MESLITRDQGIQGREACINKSFYFFTNLLPKHKLCCSLLIKHLKPKFLCPHKFIVSFSKTYKCCLLWPLLLSHFYETSVHLIKICFFFFSYSFLCQFYYSSCHKNSGGAEGEISTSLTLVKPCMILFPTTASCILFQSHRPPSHCSEKAMLFPSQRFFISCSLRLNGHILARLVPASHLGFNFDDTSLLITLFKVSLPC